VVINNPTIPCICCHTTSRNINVRKQTINDKLQGSAATYLRFGGVVNNRVKEGLLLSLSVTEKFEIGEHLAKLQARTWLSGALYLSLAVWWPGAQSA